MGTIQFDKVLSISLHGRIPNLTHVYGLNAIHDIVIVLLTSFSNSLNLVRPMNSDQIVECAYELVMTSQEDQLSIEDLVLFFKGAKEGKYGKILDRLDQQTVFSLLEQYREERFHALQRYRETKHAELKGMGPSERTVQRDELADKMGDLLGRMGNLKEQLREQKEINRMNQFNKNL